MKNDELYKALLSIDKKYIEISEDFQDISENFRRAGIRRTEALVSFAASFVLVVFAGLNVYDKSLMIQHADMLMHSSGTVSADKQSLKEDTYVNTEKAVSKTVLSDSSAGKAISAASEIITSAAMEKTAVNKNSGYASAEAGQKYTENLTASKIPAESESDKTTAFSGTVSGEKTKPAAASAVQTDNKFEDPVLDEIVMSKEFDTYTYLVGDRIYSTGAKMMDADSVGEKIEKGIVLRKYSEKTNQMYYTTADTYRIKNISDKFAVAVKFPKINTFYLYNNLNYRCDTLGKLIDDLDLENTLYLDKMYEALSTDSRPFDKELVRSFILENRNAADDGNYSNCRGAMCFKAEVELLGLYNRDIIIFKNGYITTNIDGFDEKGFYIGEEAVKKLADALQYSLDY